MTNLWHSFVAHWAIPLVSWVFGTFVGATFRWFYPSRKEWKAERRQKTERELDSKALGAIANQSLWKGPRPMTGAGIFAVRTWEIANYLGLDRETAADSLGRLEEAGKVKNDGGTLDDPTPYWHFVVR